MITEEKKIILQLHNLKKVAPRAEWKRKDRARLLMQIENRAAEEQTQAPGKEQKNYSLFRLPSFRLSRISQPMLAVILIIAFMLASSVAGINAAQNSKPGDSLYIAKIISEKTQQVLTFTDKSKARLSLEFAGKRAQELSQVLAEPNGQSKEERVEKLVMNFKREIDNVKSRIVKISPDATKAKKVLKPEIKDPAAETDEDGLPIFSAQVGRDENGIEIFEPLETTESMIIGTATGGGEEILEPDAAVTTSTDTAYISSSTDIAPEPDSSAVSDPQAILDQAELLFNSEDYSATLSKLAEADQAISQVDTGQVKGEAAADSDTATSSNPQETEDTGEVLGAMEAVGTSSVAIEEKEEAEEATSTISE